MFARVVLGSALLLSAIAASAAVQTETVSYRHGDTTLSGYLVWDDRYAGKRPGILVVHEWWGLNDYIKRRARMLAELGYVAFAADMYGEGKVTRHGDKASEWLQQITANVQRWRERAAVGLEQLRRNDRVDPQRVAAVGYCFGGATVMQLAYAGADLAGVVSFHGSLPVPDNPGQVTMKPRVLAAHGNADAFVPPERVQQFKDALDQAGADWHLVTYGGARHAFTNPDAGQFGIENLQYNADADRRSWAHMKLFFDEIFSR